MNSESPRIRFSISLAGVALGLSLVSFLLFGIAAFAGRPAAPAAGGIALLTIGGFAAARSSRAALRSALIKGGLVLVSVTISLLICEGGVRAYFALRHRDIRNYQPSFVYAYTDQRQFDRRRFISHPFLPYAPRPFDARTLFIDRAKDGNLQRYDYKQNSLGFRSPERPFAKPARCVRIITLGGSTTWDGPTDDQTWPALLEKKLTAHYEDTGYSVEVINMAADAYSSPMSLVSLEFVGVEYEPDLVISYDGINDLLVEGYDGVTSDYRSTMGRFDDTFQTLQSRLPGELFHSYLISVLTRVYDKRRGGNPDVLGQILGKARQMKPSSDPVSGVEYFERNLRLMRAISIEYKARFAGSTAHWVNPVDRQVIQNTKLKEFFGREHITYLDLDALLAHDDWSLHVDQVHWTTKGLELVSDEWSKKIIAEDLLGLNDKRRVKETRTF